ncbi:MULTISPECIES: HipA family kinase [unclassified Mannheimia]|uniref:HipA family kinase n=1 Tax=unclassified Mannheimia TaxID=2645054 RepID=UPI00359E8DF3
MAKIIFIQERTQMGITRPFICKADDNKSYIVKTSGMMPIYQLLAEWIGSTLAIKMKLPCPNIQLLHFDKLVFQLIQSEWKAALTTQTVFGSEYTLPTVTAKSSQAHNPLYLPEEMQKWLYMFDRWILNSDRTSSKVGTGNINLLFDEQKQKILVIDHNLAFDKNAQFNEHIFSIQNREWRLTLTDKKAFTEKATNILNNFEDIYQSIPDDWFPTDEDEFQKIENHIQQIKAILERIKNKHYWDNIE